MATSPLTYMVSWMDIVRFCTKRIAELSILQTCRLQHPPSYIQPSTLKLSREPRISPHVSFSPHQTWLSRSKNWLVRKVMNSRTLNKRNKVQSRVLWERDWCEGGTWYPSEHLQRTSQDAVAEFHRSHSRKPSKKTYGPSCPNVVSMFHNLTYNTQIISKSLYSPEAGAEDLQTLNFRIHVHLRKDNTQKWIYLKLTLTHSYLISKPVEYSHLWVFFLLTTKRDCLYYRHTAVTATTIQILYRSGNRIEVFDIVPLIHISPNCAWNTPVRRAVYCHTSW